MCNNLWYHQMPGSHCIVNNHNTVYEIKVLIRDCVENSISQQVYYINQSIREQNINAMSKKDKLETAIDIACDKYLFNCETNLYEMLDCKKMLNVITSKMMDTKYIQTVIDSELVGMMSIIHTDGLDSNPYMISTKSCVIEFLSNGMTLTRSMLMEDCLTCMIQHPLYKDMSVIEENSVTNLWKWMMQMFGNSYEDCTYMFKYLVSCLVGINADKLMHSWHGNGNNSKSMLSTFMEKL